MNEIWKPLSGILAFMVLATCLIYAENHGLFVLPSSNQSQFDLYCAVYPYSYNNMTSLDQNDFRIQIQKVKEIGFKGVILYNIECFYDENKLTWVMDLLKNEGLNVIAHIDYFNRTYNFPFPSEAWNKKGFFNDAELNLFNQYLTNVSEILRDYVNFKGYIVYFPYESNIDNYWFWYNKIDTLDYYWRYVHILEAIRQKDGHPIWSGVMLWSAYPLDIYGKLPKNLIYNSGFAIQPYNTIIDDVQKDKIKEIYNYFKPYGEVQIGEFGFCTQGIYEHGKASSEDKKASMIKDFLNYIKTLNHNGFVNYFGLTDFPPENADFGLIYADYSLKPSGIALKQWIASQK
jgi:hypothetical protein